MARRPVRKTTRKTSAKRSPARKKSAPVSFHCYRLVDDNGLQFFKTRKEAVENRMDDGQIGKITVSSSDDLIEALKSHSV